MKRLVSSSYSYPHLLVRRVVAGCIVFALFLSPLEIPLSELVVAPEEDPITAAESYQEHDSQTRPDVENEATVTYTRGGAVPVVEIFEEDPVLALLNTDTYSDATTSLTLPEAVALTTEETTHTTPRQLSIRAMDNHRAAVAIATGNTGSELASVTLDSAGNIVATADVHGSTETAEYDEAGQPIKITTSDGTVEYYRYDEAGRLLGISRETTVAQAPGLKGFAQRMIAPLWALADNDNDHVAFDYDADSMTTAANSAGTVQYEYDEDGLVTLETRLDGSQVEYEYDELGNVVSTIEVPAEKNKAFSLRSFLRLSYASNPLLVTQREFSSYDDNSRLGTYRIASVLESPTPDYTIADTVTDTTTITPDAIISASEIATTSVEATTESHVVPAVIPTEHGTSTPPEVLPVPAVPTVVVPTVDSADVAPSESVMEEIITFIRSTGDTIALWFDSALHRTWANESASTSTPETAVSPIATSTTLYSISFTYDAQGNVTSSETNTGIKTAYTYDSRTDSLLATIVETPNGQFSTEQYAIDTQARLRQHNGVNYLYDEAGVLVGNGVTTYTYNEQGNRITSAGADTIAYTYEGNRLETVTYSSGRTTTYTYDERGAVTHIIDSVEGTTNLAYTLAGAVASITRGDMSVSYEYDALNRRTSRTSSTDGTVYYHYNSNQLKRVTDTNNVTVREYFYTPVGTLTAVKIGDTFYHTITNYNRSVVGLINVTTGTLHTTDYDAWGRVLSSTMPSGLDIGYIGTFAEPTLGFSILGPRVYDPAIGRFLSKDPLPGLQVDLLSQNEYIYAKNDPVNQFDPSGHASELATGSASPKRSLVDTTIAITALEADLADAKATREATDPLDNDAYTQTTIDIATIESALTDLYAIHTDTQATIAANEAEAAAALLPTPVATATIEAVWGIAVQSETSTTTVVMNASSSSSTASDDIVATGTVESITPPVESTTTDSVTSSPEATSSPLDRATEPMVIIDVAPITETTPATPSETVSLRITDGIVALASTVFGGHLLSVEAKSKSKSKTKSKSKKRDDNKKVTSSKAKSKQAEKSKTIARLERQVKGLQTKLAAVQKRDTRSRNRGISQAELSSLTKQVYSAAITVATLTVQKVTNDREVAAAKSRAQTLATSASNLAVATTKQKKTIRTTPSTPVAQSVYGPSRPPQSAGVAAPVLSFEQPDVPWWKTATSVAVSLVPGVGEGYDIATLVYGKDPITGESLTTATTLITALGLLSGVGSGKIAREAYTASLRKISSEIGVTIDELTEASEQVARKYGSYFTSREGIMQLNGRLSLDSFFVEVKVVAKENKAHALAESVIVTQKIVNDFSTRGWSDQLIRQTIKTPHATRVATNKANNNPATAYYQVDGSYAVIDNVTKEVIQVSKIGDKNWIPDSTIVNPYTP